MRTRVLASLTTVLVATWALSGCGSGDSDAKAGADGDIKRIQDYGPIQLDGVTHIGDVTLPEQGDDVQPFTVGTTDGGGYVRTSDHGDGAVTHTELFTSDGVLDREFPTSGVALTDPDAGTAAWVEVAGDRQTVVLSDLVGGRELGRWPLDDDGDLLTVVRGEEAVVAVDDGPVVFRAGERHPSRLAFLGENWLVLGLDGEHVVAWDSDEESLTTFTREGAEIGSIEGDPRGGLSPDGAWVATLRQEDDEEDVELVLATVEGDRREVELEGRDPYGVSWLDADTLVVDTGLSDSGDDADADIRRYVCEIASGECEETARPAGRHWIDPLMPNDASAAISTIGS